MLCLVAVGMLVAYLVHGDRDEESSDNTAGANLEAGRLFVEHLVKRVEGTCESGREAYDHAHDGGVDALKKCVHALEDYAKGVRMHEQLAYSTHGRYRRAFVQTYALLSSVLEKDKKNLYKFKETFKADHQKAADYLKDRLDKIKETALDMAGKSKETALDMAGESKEPQDASQEVSSLLSKSTIAAKRQAVNKSTSVAKKYVKSWRTAVMKRRALMQASAAVKMHAEMSVLEKSSTAKNKYTVKNLHTGRMKTSSAVLRKASLQKTKLVKHTRNNKKDAKHGRTVAKHGRPHRRQVHHHGHNDHENLPLHKNY
jgi:hypothetical protein